MRWRAAHFAEVVRRIDEAFPEVMVPHAVDDHAPRQRVRGVGQPVGECRTALPFIAQIASRKMPVQPRHRLHPGGGHDRTGLGNFTANE